MIPNHPSEYDSRASYAYWTACAVDREVKVRQGARIGLGLLVIAALAVCGVCRADQIRVLDTGSMRQSYLEPHRAGWVAPGGQLMNLQAVPISQVKIGQVVVYRHSKAGLVAHRVIEAKKGHLWTKGDSNRMPDDEYVTAKNYLGVVSK